MRRSNRQSRALVRRGADHRLDRQRRAPAGPTAFAPAAAEQVQEAARLWLDKRRSVTGYIIKENSPLAEQGTAGGEDPAGGEALMRRVLACTALGLLAAADPATAMDIERIVSPSGHQGLAGARAVRCPW